MSTYWEHFFAQNHRQHLNETCQNVNIIPPDSSRLNHSISKTKLLPSLQINTSSVNSSWNVSFFNATHLSQRLQRLYMKNIYKLVKSKKFSSFTFISHLNRIITTVSNYFVFSNWDIFYLVSIRFVRFKIFMSDGY